MIYSIKRFTAYDDQLIQLKSRGDEFLATIDFGQEDPIELMKRGNLRKLRGKKFNWRFEDGDKISDCPFHIGALPIFQTKKLGNALSGINVELIPIEVEGVSYTIVGAPEFQGGLDLDNSEVNYFSGGKKIMWVKKYMFNPDIDYPKMFFLEEFPLFTFCTNDVFRRLARCGFEDLRIVECRKERGNRFGVKRFSYYWGSRQPKAKEFESQGTPEKKYVWLKKHCGKDITPWHLEFLKLEEKIGDPEQLYVSCTGEIDFDNDFIELFWDFSSKTWLDGETPITISLWEYLVRRLIKTKSKELYSEICNASWLNKKMKL